MLADTTKRVYGYDIMRASAILLVLASHTHSHISSHVDEALYYVFVPNGVSLFFVLSGFLIGNILIELVDKTDFTFRQLGNFWIRRWFRTLPAYFCILAVMMALDIHLYDRDLGFYVKYWVFLQSVSDGHPVIYPESWSLAVEEWFYILVPLAAFLLVKLVPCSRKQLLLSLICLILLAVTAARCYKIYQLGISSYAAWDVYIDKTLFMRMDAIIFGVLGAWLHYYRHPVWKHQNILFLGGMLLLFYPNVHIWAFGFDTFSSYGQSTVKGMAGLLLLPKMSTIKSGEGKVYQFITFTSTISYSIYLVNFYPFNQFGLTCLKRVGVPEQHTMIWDMVRLLAFFCWTAVFSFGLYKLVEEPFMRLRNRLPKAEPGSVVSFKPSTKSIS